MKEKFIIIFIIALFSLVWVYFQTSKIKEKKEVTKVEMTTAMMMNIVALASISMVVGFIEIPVSFIGAKFDLSEVIILLSYFILGFKGSLTVIGLRSLGRLILIPPRTAIEGDLIWRLLGEGIAIIASLAIILSYVVVKLILKNKEKPLFYAVPSNIELEDEKTVKKKNKLMLIILPILTAIILNVVMIIFHTIITMPMFLSTNEHFTIFSLLKDPNYSNQTIFGIIKTIVTMFGLLNLIKGIISPLIFLLLKPRVEKIVK